MYKTPPDMKIVAAAVSSMQHELEKQAQVLHSAIVQRESELSEAKWFSGQGLAALDMKLLPWIRHDAVAKKNVARVFQKMCITICMHGNQRG